MGEFSYTLTMKAVQRMLFAWRRFFFRVSVRIPVIIGCSKFALRHFELRGQGLAARHTRSHPAARPVARFA
jgi:hypothetical protein